MYQTDEGYIFGEIKVGVWSSCIFCL